MIYHVSINGSDQNIGTADAPFRTINHAAQIAAPGDTVQVHEGVYREWVSPRNGGLNHYNRITYEVAPGEHAVIKGSEIVTGWQRVDGTVWKVSVPNSLFGDWNPYAKRVEGDWFAEPKTYAVHLGDVYIDGLSMFEASSREDLFEAKPRSSMAARSVYRWMAEVGADETIIYGNFQEIDPNSVLTEINVRPCCFYPRQIGVNYITLRGFEIAQAACPFVPPTSDQIGMVGPNWSMGWIIEDNHLHDAKCCAISLGKEGSTGDNDYTRFPERMHSHYYQLEAVFRGVKSGWSREKIGSHIVRNNHIHDCEQCGIVGHMGCVYSRIEHNHIHHIRVKREFLGAEIAGIKLHAAIDVVLENNNIHDAWVGIWLDWEAQGTRVTRNLLHHNVHDFLIEMCHGPTVVDNNVFLSRHDLTSYSQGTAYVHNLFNGNLKYELDMARHVPYHYPHGTEVLGIVPVHGGDDRFYNNIVLGNPSPDPRYPTMHTFYNQCPTAEEFSKVGFNMKGGTLPVFFAENVYAGVAEPYRAEQNPTRAEGATASVEEQDGVWYLTVDLPAALPTVESVSTERLGLPFFVKQAYETPNGSPIDFALDLCGNSRAARPVAGPLATLASGKQTLEVWRE